MDTAAAKYVEDGYGYTFIYLFIGDFHLYNSVKWAHSFSDILVWYEVVGNICT
jgi:hypothetical protein